MRSVLGTASIATSAAIVICFWLWLSYCRHIYDKAIEHKQKPDPHKMIKAASRGPFHRRLGKPPPLPRKPENKPPAK
jgi:hypothetical protein